MTTDRTTDILIVGSGIMGAATARLLRERLPALRITMIDGGRPIGESGGHLHDSRDPEIWERYNQRVASGIQGLYAGDELLQPAASGVDALEPGLHRLGVLGERAEAMPGAALAWNVGGMGAHWTAATPWPDGAERFGDPGRWEHDLSTARRLLHVMPSPLGPTPVGRIVLDALSRRFGAGEAAGRGPQPMPMAVQEVDGRLERVGPARIFPPIGGAEDPAFELLPGTLAVELRQDGGRVRGARVREVATGDEALIAAEVVVVCADAMRTPQLLFASGIRSPALGRHLNEHAFVSNRILLDLDRFGLTLDDLPDLLPGEFATDSLWLPQTGDQPYQAQIMSRTYRDDDGAPLAYGVGFSVYVPVESRAENRLVFDERETDVFGLPRMSVEFSYSERDRALIDGVVPFMTGVAEEIGDWDPATESRLLPAGSSLHYTGTVRSGAADDGTSVCDEAGRVWGFDNLYVAGNGVVPTALACNSTLTGVVTAVRAAEAVVARVEEGVRPHLAVVSERRP